MSQTPARRYEFDAKLPISPVDPGTSILVQTPSIGGTHRPVMKLLDGSDDEGLVMVTTTNGGDDTISRFEACGGRYAPERMAVIDCSEGAAESQSRNIQTLSGPEDLTGISILYSSLYEQLYDSGVSRVRSGFFTLSPLLVYIDEFRRLFRFLNNLTGRVTTADGLGIFVIDPESTDAKTRRTLTEAFDGSISIRSTESESEYELRVRGLGNQPEGWQSFRLPESR